MPRYLHFRLRIHMRYCCVSHDEKRHVINRNSKYTMYVKRLNASGTREISINSERLFNIRCIVLEWELFSFFNLDSLELYRLKLKRLYFMDTVEYIIFYLSNKNIHGPSQVRPKIDVAELVRVASGTLPLHLAVRSLHRISCALVRVFCVVRRQRNR